VEKMIEAGNETRSDDRREGLSSSDLPSLELQALPESKREFSTTRTGIAPAT
jgi:hypothetical protein